MVNVIDWNIVWRIQRDIAGLFFLQSEYDYIYGDIPYLEVYNSPYWLILTEKIPEMNNEEEVFLVNGCCMFMMCIIIDFLEGSGNYRDGVIWEDYENRVINRDSLNIILYNDLIKLIKIANSDRKSYNYKEYSRSKQEFDRICMSYLLSRGHDVYTLGGVSAPHMGMILPPQGNAAGKEQDE